MVVDIDGESIGFIVDAVTEVLRIPQDSVEPTSALMTTKDSYYIDGIAKLGDRLLILLDLDRALSSAERETLTEVSATAAVSSNGPTPAQAAA